MLLFFILFRPFQNITTDGGVQWNSFEDQNVTYIFAINHGTVGRYETMSQVMKLHRNETLELVQNIATKGGSDVGFFTTNGVHYTMIINMKDNSGNSVQRSQVSFPTFDITYCLAFSWYVPHGLICMLKGSVSFYA